MILQTGMRTDIPAFYSEWFMNRIKEGYVLVRNPYYPEQLTRYEINTNVVDLIAFCTKDPIPMMNYTEKLKAYGQYWFVTITPYGKDLEPNVPDKNIVIKCFRELSGIIGIKVTSKSHLKFGKNQADNLTAVFNRFILDFGAGFFCILLVFSIRCYLRYNNYEKID